MSITTTQKTERVTRTISVVTCDGPDCTHTAEFDRRVHPVPPGWIFLDTGDSKSSGHFCSRDCLADAVVP